MSKCLLVTGGNGFVAGSIITQAGSDYDLHVVSRGPAPTQRPDLTWYAADATDEDVLHDLLHDVEPDAVIHTAALADIDYCQAHQDEAVKINVEFTRELAEICADHDIKFVHCSTDNVFDGERMEYTEKDALNPVNFYGETKVRAEWAVTAAGGKAVIARVALVMGLPMLGAGNSFVSRMITNLSQGKEVTSPAKEVRSPVDVISLARALVELASNDWTGTIHLAGNDIMNRHEMMQRIAKKLGYDPKLIVPNDPENIPGRAPRPRNVSLRNIKARSVLKTPMVGLEQGLDLVLEAKKGVSK